MVLLDAHIHLIDNEFSDYRQHIFRSLRELRMKACSVTVDTNSLQKSLECFDDSTRDVVFLFAGIHPENAASDDLNVFYDVFNNNINSIDGIGEIGLDPTYEDRSGSIYSKQVEVFNRMLCLAEKIRKPVSIHSRGSLNHILEILKSYDLMGVMLHWFEGSMKQLAISDDMDLFVSYGPSLIYSKEKKALLRKTRKDKILVETDGPVKYRGCFNNFPSMSTSFLISVANCVAVALGMTYEETEALLERNSEGYLSRKL
ncbi:TatD family hydrolase [Nitrososphaera sp. AFS]|jgi:TatD DNase family protein|uniref:TatD family hydrolase n=1 Tax=Nitrososphaera sp. AFS TaxID=2301191 RepID=UPI00139243E7|nr:TatD family hydrolase [Nitrososphaera sp. AFS]NAL76682.1 TatD family deoxyribonuclease [Nitrososphaera sp. AFS]